MLYLRLWMGGGGRMSTYDRVGVNVLPLEDITIPYIFLNVYPICKNMAVVKNYETRNDTYGKTACIGRLRT